MSNRNYVWRGGQHLDSLQNVKKLAKRSDQPCDYINVNSQDACLLSTLHIEQ